MLVAALALAAALPAPRANPFCDALRTVAAGAATGFVTVRGPALSPQVFQARVVLPEATACSVFVPRGSEPATYACTFSGGIDVKRAMGRLVRRSARCVEVGVGNPPRLKDAPDGPRFYFPSGIARFDFSARRVLATPRLWSVTLAVTRGPNQPRRPLA